MSDADDHLTSLRASADQRMAESMADLMNLAAKYDGLDMTSAVAQFHRSLFEGDTTREGLAAAAALLALKLHRGDRS